MSAGWEVGDLALCVVSGPCRNECGNVIDASTRLKNGHVYLVLGIGLHNSLFLQGLTAINQDRGAGFNPLRFRKIKPDQHEDCEPEFVTLLNRIKRPAKQGETA